MTTRPMNASPSPGGSLLPAAAAALFALMATTPARSQATSNPNQIVGSVRFSNVNAEIRAILDAADRTYSWRVEARGTARVNPPIHTTNVSSPTRGSLDYEVTVETDPAGRQFFVSPRLGMGSRLSYWLLRKSSPYVYPEPAPDVVLDFAECAGAVRARWVDSAGAPFAVASSVLSTYRSDIDGAGTSGNQAMEGFDPGAAESVLIARGDGEAATFRADYTAGSDPFSDLLIFRSESSVTLDCDEIIERQYVVPTGPGGSGSLGTLLGEADVLGFDEVPFDASRDEDELTLVWANFGPNRNVRYDWLRSTPASGPYELENMMPGQYRVGATFGLLPGPHFQVFETPWAAISPIAGVRSDLGDLLVVDPGRIVGDILLQGPAPLPSPVGTPFEDLLLATGPRHDTDGDGIPNYPGSMYLRSHLYASGEDALAPGQTLLTSMGFSRAAFGGALEPGTGRFVGDYEQILGGLRRESKRWNAVRCQLEVSDTDETDPRAYRSFSVTVDDATLENLAIQPGVVRTIPRHYCFSELVITYHALAGTFIRPALRPTSDGAFSGIDFEGRAADYVALIGQASGTPVSTPAAEGHLVIALPEGDYALDPSITAVSPGGGTTDTQLSPIALSVGCAQRIEIHTDLVLDLDGVPGCVPGPFLRLAGQVLAQRPIASIRYQIDGGAPVVICSACGADPRFSEDVPVDEATTSFRIEAEDESGHVASVEGPVHVGAIEPSARDLRPGAEPLRVRMERDGSWGLLLTWEDIPGQVANVAVGSIESLWVDRTYDHMTIPRGRCRVAGGTAALGYSPSDIYIVVGAPCGSDGSYGRDSFGRERAPASPGCP